MRPLHEAVENGHCELVRLLITYGADPTMTNYSGQTCLTLANNDDQMKQLLEGIMADLKGKHSLKWDFTGPSGIVG